MKNAWPSDSISAMASSSNIGSMANRFVFTTRRSRPASDVPSAIRARISFSSGPRARTRGFSR